VGLTCIRWDVVEGIGRGRARIQMPCAYAHVGPSLRACLLRLIRGLTVCNDQLVLEFLVQKKERCDDPARAAHEPEACRHSGGEPIELGVLWEESTNCHFGLRRMQC